jgi:hypothetical protein
MTETSLELRLERYKDASNAVFNKLKQFQNGGSIRKRYIDGALQVEYSFGVGGMCFRADIRRREDETVLNDNRLLVPSVHGRELPMLVWVGNVAQGFHPSASLVRLQVLDSSNLAIGKAVQIRRSVRVEAVLTVFGELAVLNGELSPILLPGEFINKIIEGCPQIVDDLANDNGDVFGEFADRTVVDTQNGTGSRIDEVIKDLCLCRVVIGDEFILVLFPKLINQRIQFVNVDTGPINPSVCAV